MRVTPLDIRKQEFRKTMRGLDADEVYAFLNTVAEEYEIVLSDNKKLRERIVELEERLKEYKKIETNLRNTLLTAERLTAEAKENARKEARLIIREAEMEAEKAAEAIRAQTRELRREVLELKKRKDEYIAKMKSMLDYHRNFIENFEKDFGEADAEVERIGKKVEQDTTKVQQTRRMSRERITEKFGGETEGKVTWGDERKPEEERPTVPRPEWHHKKKQTDLKQALDNEQTGSQKVDSSSQQPEIPHLDTEPIGAVLDEVPPREIVDREVSPDDLAEPDRETWEEKSIKETVARSIEEKLYPEPDEVKIDSNLEEEGIGKGHYPDQQTPDMGVPGPGETTGNEHVESATEPPHPHSQDEWKGYDVRDEQTDWRDYEVPVDKTAPAGAGFPERADDEEVTPHDQPLQQNDSHPVDDSEVEEALSGLKEVTEEKENNNPGWSMEELRKNLTNLGGDEES